MRVVTLLPAATEIVAALGGADQLVGVSHECDYPGWVRRLARVTATSIDVNTPGRVIDTEVSRLRSTGRPVIAIDADQLSTLAPDLIITQGLCEVCAVSDGAVHQLADGFERRPRILSLNASDLSGIWNDIAQVGRALDLKAEADELVVGLRSRVARLHASSVLPTPAVLCVEWLDPLYLAGHWVPELVAAAGGRDVGAKRGSHSVRRDWKELKGLDPDHVVVMLCGFGLERARLELDELRDPDALELMQRVPTWILDGNAYTSRAGPRVIDGAAQIRSVVLGEPAHGVESWQPVLC
jgi:iron complex transport system substrate-binding protein